MGKGTIDSHIADGEYEVQLKYSRDTFDRRVSQLNSKIADLETRIADVEAALEYGAEYGGL